MQSNTIKPGDLVRITSTSFPYFEDRLAIALETTNFKASDTTYVVCFLVDLLPDKAIHTFNVDELELVSRATNKNERNEIQHRRSCKL